MRILKIIKDNKLVTLSLIHGFYVNFFYYQKKYKIPLKKKWKISLLYEIINHFSFIGDKYNVLHGILSLIGGILPLKELTNDDDLVKKLCNNVFILGISNLPLNLMEFNNNYIIKLWFAISFIYYRIIISLPNYIKILYNNNLTNTNYRIKLFIILNGLVHCLNIIWTKKIIYKFLIKFKK